MKGKEGKMDIAVAANMYLNDLPIIVDEYKYSVRIIFTDGERQLFTKQQWEDACYEAIEKMNL